MSERTNLQLALALAARGWHIIPCNPETKRPVIKSAHPVGDPLYRKCRGACGKDGHGLHDATTDPAKIRAWWNRHPNAIPGVNCERSGVWVLDVDRGHGTDGLASLNQLVRERGGGQMFPVSAGQRTRSGGYHLIFTLPDGLDIPTNEGQLAPGLDLRGRRGGYFCTGSGYTPLEGVDMTTAEVGPAPAWLVEAALATNRKREPRPSTITSYPTPDASELDQWGRGWVDQAINTAVPGNRNRTIYDAGQQLYWCGISPAVAEDYAIEFAHATGLPESEAIKTMQSAYATIKPGEPAPPPGYRRHRSIMLPLQNKTNGNGKHAESVEGGTPYTPPTEQKNGKTDKLPPPTHADLAARWIEQYPDTVYGVQEWRRYQAGAWPAVDADAITAEINRIVLAAQSEGVKPTSGMIASVQEIARQLVYIPTREWDADPDLLPCANGVLHIPSMTLRPHNPANRFTFRTAYDYDPNADAPTWRYFLDTTLDPETQALLQEFAGYSLTTDTRYETALWLHGKRGSGKSTFIEGLRAMLGDRAGLLGLARIEKSRFALWGIVGKTLLTATEQPAVFIQQSDVLNALISGEAITVERKFKDEVEITPVCKILWAMNELPRVPNGENGIFRRVKVIKFPDRPEGQRDERVKENIKGEGSGILNWALTGLARLRKNNRFTVPENVARASKEFEDANNLPARFAEECCLIGPEYRTQATPLYKAYARWAIEHGHKPVSDTTLASDWEAMGLIRKRINGRSYWLGIGLRDDWEDQ